MGGINPLINLAISETNLGLRNSRTGAKIRLVHSELVSYTEASSYRLDIQRLRNKNDSYLESVHGLRDQYGADIVIMLSNSEGVCGVAYHLMSNPTSTSNEDKAFAIVIPNCATGKYTFAHEIGHLMGARHNWEADGKNNSPYTFNHGYFNATDSWRTIMSYADSSCVNYCSRILYWSNPDLTYNGSALGKAEGSDFAADNRKTWTLTKDAVSRYRNTVVPPPKPKGHIVPIIFLILFDDQGEQLQ